MGMSDKPTIRVVVSREVDGAHGVYDPQGRVRVWHSGANRYGWADLFVTWDEVEPSAAVELHQNGGVFRVSPGEYRLDVDSGGYLLSKMAPGASDAGSSGSQIQDEGVEPGPSGDDQSASPVPSAPRRPFAGMERQLADHRHQLKALRDHLGVIERTFTRYESFSDLRDRVDRLEARLAGGVAIVGRIRTLESHAVDQRLRIAQLEHDLREATQREEP